MDVKHHPWKPYGEDLPMICYCSSLVVWFQVGTPKTHRRYLARDEGTYGPMPRDVPKGLLGMPFNTTVSLILEYTYDYRSHGYVTDWPYDSQGVNSLYCVGDSCFPGQGVIAVAFSGVMCAHRVAADIGALKFLHNGIYDIRSHMPFDYALAMHPYDM